MATIAAAAAAAAAGPPKLFYYSPTVATCQHSPTAAVLPVASAAPPPFVATAAMLGSAWSPFDLGQILAMNGFQPQGTFRPALTFVSSQPITGNVSSRRFPSQRMRKR
ncbi:angiomotin [Trichinella spiralis]|nr:angiomotin [Trichinella spiralis]